MRIRIPIFTQTLHLPNSASVSATKARYQKVQVKPKHHHCKRSAYANVSTGPFGVRLRLGMLELAPEKDQGKGCFE
ncbi:hypothetical protein BofuT4_uP158530.1 [Botrytis cinerea T4]|uniref:Uncharacterized protein n=1 Tax=Botryotinia fuckeliana (strain T4) TaxID=999810 RepID=G2YV09_BOTF4|nr:hypothetical protein BofuT4_uP158530.1 [Botrytis cinerea T4]